MAPGGEIAADRFGDIGNLSTLSIALIGVGTLLFGLLAWFIDYRIGRRLAPLVERLNRVEHEVTANGGVVRKRDGAVDLDATTTKDLTVEQSDQLKNIEQMLRVLLLNKPK